MLKLLFLDVDGTLTGGSVYISNEGELFKEFNVKDGLGISQRLSSKGIVPVVVTGRYSASTQIRCEELGIDMVYQGIEDKKNLIVSICKEKKVLFNEVAYIGDDINDLASMQLIKAKGGIIGCPFDAIEDVKSICNFVSSKSGGKGAVRDFIEYLIRNMNESL